MTVVKVYRQAFGIVKELPEPVEGTTYIVSTIVIVVPRYRPEVIALATGYPEVVQLKIR